MGAKHVNSENFESLVLNADQPTIVDFYADWCGPCRMMNPVVEELARELAGMAQVVKVNVDEAPEVASRFGVQSIPTFVVLRDGKAKQQLVGVQSKQALKSALAG
ncbi:MAG: thioredoxin [bacterium]|nr:thioredoxin [bacterium]